MAYFGFNADEALVLGAGFMYTTYGFQKSPYASHHALGARYASATKALELEYDGIFTSVVGGLDLNLHFIIRDPRYTRIISAWEMKLKKQRMTRIITGLGSASYISSGNQQDIQTKYFFCRIFYQQYNIENTEGKIYFRYYRQTDWTRRFLNGSDLLE